MFLLKWIIRPYLFFQYYFQKYTNTGTFGKNHAVYIPSPHVDTGNFIKDALFRHHVKQFHDSSCSVASVASIINTLLERQGALNKIPVTQQDLLEQVIAAHWKERMSDNGYKGRRGLPLEILGQVVEASLKTYNIQYQSIETVQVTQDPGKSEKARQLLLKRIEQFETQGNCLIISHFDQGSFLPEFHIPHISPLGGIDPVSKKVIILDVDPTQINPYTIPFEIFYKGLAYNYNIFFRKFGYAEGGYVFIQV